MPTFQSVQAALAVRRQRRAGRPVKKSTSSTNFGRSPRPSVVSIDGKVHCDKANESMLETKVMGEVTMFHIGIVFVLLGSIMTITGLIPGYVTDDKWDDLIGTGLFILFIGGLLILIHKLVSGNEEKELSNYVKKKLSKSRSAGLNNDPEIGSPLSHTVSFPSQDSSRDIPDVHHHNRRSPTSPTVKVEIPLDKITEESERDDKDHRKTQFSSYTEHHFDSIETSPDSNENATLTSPKQETQGLLKYKMPRRPRY